MIQVIASETIKIGRGLRQIRSMRGITQEELSIAADLTIQFISQVENEKKEVSHMVAQRIADALSIPVSFLYLLADRSDNLLVKEMQEIVKASLSLSSSTDAKPIK